MKRVGFAVLLLVVAAGFWGCSTAPRRAECYRTPVTAYSTPSVQYQGMPAVTSAINNNSAEGARLKQQISDQEAALAQAEADKRALEDKLNDALASKKFATKKKEDSDLK